MAIPFAVKLDDVKAVFGSKDETLLEKIKTTELYGTYKDQCDEDLSKPYKYSFDDVLTDIIFNYVKPEARTTSKNTFSKSDKQPLLTGLKQELASEYRYALLTICHYLGLHLVTTDGGFYNDNDFKFVHVMLIKAGLKTDLSKIFENHFVFDIPETTELPAICCLTKEEINHTHSVLSNLKPDDELMDDDEILQILSELQQAFRVCSDTNTDLIFFTH